MGFITKPEAFTISELKSTIMDRLHMGGSFLQQSQSVTVGGLPVAIKLGGLPSPGGLGGLTSIASTIQSSGLSSLVANPMSAVQGALGSSLSGISGQLGSITSKLNPAQEGLLSGAVSSVSSSLSSFSSHTDLLSGVTVSGSDTIPDLSKLMDTGNTLKSLTNVPSSDFVQNTASSLFADQHLTDIKDQLNITVANKLTQIGNLDKTADADQINTLVNEVAGIMNDHSNTLSNFVTNDRHNFNEAGNNISASATTLSMAGNYANPDSISNILLNHVGSDTLLTGLQSVTSTANG